MAKSRLLRRAPHRSDERWGRRDRMFCRQCSSEVELQRELKIARTLRCVDHAEIAASEHVGYITLHQQDGRVEGVDGFRPELQILTFSNSEEFGKSEVHVLQPRA